jgi:hypothetical protein
MEPTPPFGGVRPLQSTLRHIAKAKKTILKIILSEKIEYGTLLNSNHVIDRT